LTTTNASTPMVQTVDLTKRFGEFTALDALSIQLQQGQILGYIGPNGAGKTTTIRILVGLSRPTSGQAFVAGVDCTRDTGKLKQLVGFMPDTFGAYDNMRVREYLDFFGAAFRIPRRKRVQRVEEVMDLTGSAYMKDLYVDSLSHGMKQRVGVARTLLHDPPLLILDEPANGLDPNARIEMRQLLLRLAEMGKTIIVTSHILPELSRICDTVAIITEGKLRAFGPLDKIMRDISQRRVFQVSVNRESDVERAAQLLRDNLEEAAEVDTSPQELEVRFTTEADDNRIGDLLQLTVAANVSVIQFHEVPLDLEDAFLEVTGTGRIHKQVTR
jgi:ABC-2 type transport system ATP-binding protein